MDLSVVIVNYNVKYFLEQCLYSVAAASKGLAVETIVVDNASTDHSLEYVRPKFPEVIFIASNDNTGFARGCNLGVQRSSGKYILFLNPDTIVPENCFTACLSFFETHPDAGALGVRMIDGSGQFLKESKRAFPSPMTSLYKLFGLARIFPRSKSFARYHLGHLDEHATNEVDVLAGAFMMTRKSILDSIGSFDETFFMYGEDVDLSYRIQKTTIPGSNNTYKNYYFPGTSIIHFKGESTRKGSMNYVRMFYNAMSIFVRKHYGGRSAGIFNFFIQVAIWFRAALSATGNFIRKIGLPLIDAGLILLSFWLMKNIWTSYVRTETEYETRLLWIAFPAFTIFYLAAAYFAGLYDRWYKRKELISSTLVATVVLLAGYALLPEHYRFSRGIVLFGAILAFLLISGLRWILIATGVLQSNNEKEQRGTVVIAGTDEEFQTTKELFQQAGLQDKILGRIAPPGTNGAALGDLNKIKALSGVIPFKEIIFCQGALRFETLINALESLPGNITAKIHAAGSTSIVGSDSKDSAGESVSKENGYKLADPYQRRMKRLLDILVAIAGVISFPLTIFLIKNPGRFFINCLSVMAGKKTWIGYAVEEKKLPFLVPGVLACNGLSLSKPQQFPRESLQMMDYWYARDFEATNDLKIIWKMFRHLGG